MHPGWHPSSSRGAKSTRSIASDGACDIHYQAPKCITFGGRVVHTLEAMKHVGYGSHRSETSRVLCKGPYMHTPIDPAHSQIHT